MDDMTLNHIVRIHPSGRSILAALGLDPEADGDRCLDELCWQRGLDVEAVLRALNRPAAKQAPGRKAVKALAK